MARAVLWGPATSWSDLGLADQPSSGLQQRKKQVAYEERRDFVLFSYTLLSFFFLSFYDLFLNITPPHPSNILFWKVGRLCWYLAKGKRYIGGGGVWRERVGGFSKKLKCHHAHHGSSSCPNVGEKLLPLRPDWNQTRKPTNCEDRDLSAWQNWKDRRKKKKSTQHSSEFWKEETNWKSVEEQVWTHST